MLSENMIWTTGQAQAFAVSVPEDIFNSDCREVTGKLQQQQQHSSVTRDAVGDTSTKSLTHLPKIGSSSQT